MTWMLLQSHHLIVISVMTTASTRKSRLSFSPDGTCTVQGIFVFPTVMELPATSDRDDGPP